MGKTSKKLNPESLADHTILLPIRKKSMRSTDTFSGGFADHVER